ncbi:MAG: Tol-Pal system beta propeller repeat protein TolB [Pseudomonadota bacterium]
MCKISIVPFIYYFAAITSLQAQVEINITRGKVEALPIAIPIFEASDPQTLDLAKKISGIIANNLQNSGLFRVIPTSAHIEKNLSLNQAPKFADWRIIKAKSVVIGRVGWDNQGRLRAEFRLWDVIIQKQLMGQQFFTNPNNWRRIGHIISDALYKRLTGESGYFDSRVVFIDETGAKNKRIKRLAVMDQDSADIQFLSDGKNLVLTPRFSPTRQELTYMSYEKGVPRVYLYNLKTGQRQIVGDFPGMTFAPRFSPDGNKIIMSLSKEGETNIFLMDLQTKNVQQITQNNNINTSPSFAPDGDRIVFESDQDGGQQLYVSSLSKTGATRISRGEGRYSTPVWSPRGDLIAFTKQYRGLFLIGVMHPDGSGERILTEGFHNEGPTWSPNGRVIMFFRESRGAKGGPQLYSVDLTGYNERLVPTPYFASDPAWSPMRK